MGYYYDKSSDNNSSDEDVDGSWSSSSFHANARERSDEEESISSLSESEEEEETTRASKTRKTSTGASVASSSSDKKKGKDVGTGGAAASSSSSSATAADKKLQKKKEEQQRCYADEALAKYGLPSSCKTQLSEKLWKCYIKLRRAMEASAADTREEIDETSPVGKYVIDSLEKAVEKTNLSAEAKEILLKKMIFYVSEDVEYDPSGDVGDLEVHTRIYSLVSPAALDIYLHYRDDGIRQRFPCSLSFSVRSWDNLKRDLVKFAKRRQYTRVAVEDHDPKDWSAQGVRPNWTQLFYFRESNSRRKARLSVSSDLDEGHFDEIREMLFGEDPRFPKVLSSFDLARIILIAGGLTTSYSPCFNSQVFKPSKAVKLLEEEFGM